MKKFLAVIPITVIIILLSPKHIVFADIVNFNNAVWLYGNITGSSQGAKRWYLCTSQGNNGVVILTKNTSQIYFSGYIYNADVGELEGNRVSSAYLYYIDSYVLGGAVISYSGSGQDDLDGFDSVQEYEDYINPPQPEPTWFEIWGNALDQFLEDWLPWAVDLDHYFDDLTMWMFGMELSGDDVQYGNDIEYYDFPTPTPFPTQIPYQQQVIPDGNGGFTIQYIYNNPSGIPITATAPPPEPTYSIQITDSPQYDISGVPVPPADGLQDAIDAIDDNIDDYQEGFEAIHGSFSTIPIKWFFFFGIPAAILLIAGIIRSLLGG